MVDIISGGCEGQIYSYCIKHKVRHRAQNVIMKGHSSFHGELSLSNGMGKPF